MKKTEKLQIYEEDYIPNEWEDDEDMFKLKSAIQELRPAERLILLSYVEGGTFTSVAERYSVSLPTAKKYIQEVITKIKEKILEEE